MPLNKEQPVSHFSQITCGNCEAACCRKGTLMPLDNDETAFMHAGGVGLEQVQEAPKTIGRKVLSMLTRSPEPLPRYELQDDCGYLLPPDPTTGKRLCGVYNDERKPAICGEFKEQSYGCIDTRMRRGVDPSQIQEEYLKITQS